MRKILSLSIITLSLALALVRPLRADETIHVKTHDKVKVVTDPSKGYNSYPSWGVFPSDSTQYRKVVLYVTYACPDSQHCGEWDYIDDVFLRQIGGSKGDAKEIELARLISPYGWQFDSTWSFTWHVDITDFSFLLHDSVQIEFRHGGYEKNDDRGWLITLDFQLTEGRPAVNVLGMDSLWCGTIPYGDPSKPADSLLKPVTFTDTDDATMARLRILQTGHGMDDMENCAEFCSKWRQVYFDDSLIDQRQIWRQCGQNPLYPQAGTWIFDRANWCPGSMVFPDVYDYPITPGSSHSVDIKLQPYTDTLKPSANYFLYSYLFLCTSPWANSDVALEDIVAPSTADEYSRQNPICGNPIIRVRNYGRDPLKSVIVHYGLVGDEPQMYEWVGRIESQQSGEIDLPGLVTVREGKQQFHVLLEEPNGEEDEYPGDNEGSSTASMPPVYGNNFILVFRSNADSTDNSYYVADVDGNELIGRPIGSLAPNTFYYDTLNLPDGCYHLVVDDTSSTGLNIWFNPEGGYGFVRLLDMKGHLLHAFDSDFGRSIDYWFRTSKSAAPTPEPDTMLVNPFPLRSDGKLDVEVFLNEAADVKLRISPADSARIAFEKDYENVKESFLPVDISGEPDGVYFITATSGDKKAVRRIRIKHESQP